MRDYDSEFEMVGRLKVGDQIWQTQSRFRNNDKYILMLLMKVMMQKMLLLMVLFIY